MPETEEVARRPDQAEEVAKYVGGDIGAARDDLDYCMRELNVHNRLEMLRQIFPHLASEIRRRRESYSGRLDIGDITLESK